MLVLGSFCSGDAPSLAVLPADNLGSDDASTGPFFPSPVDGVLDGGFLFHGFFFGEVLTDAW